MSIFEAKPQRYDFSATLSQNALRKISVLSQYVKDRRAECKVKTCFQTLLRRGCSSGEAQRAIRGRSLKGCARIGSEREDGANAVAVGLVVLSAEEPAETVVIARTLSADVQTDGATDGILGTRPAK